MLRETIIDRPKYLHQNELILEFQLNLWSNRKFFTKIADSKKSDPSRSVSNGCSAGGRVEFIWTLENAQLLLENPKSEHTSLPCFLQSPPFPANSGSGKKDLFLLRLFPRGYRSDGQYMSVGCWNLSTEKLLVHSKIYLHTEEISSARIGLFCSCAN